MSTTNTVIFLSIGTFERTLSREIDGAPPSLKKLSFAQILPKSLQGLASPRDGGLEHMKKEITKKLRQIGFPLGILLLTPFDASVVLESQWYPSRNPSSLQPAYLFDISLSDTKSFPVGSTRLSSYISKINSSRHADLITRVDFLFQTLSSSQNRERLRLTRIAHLIGLISQSGKINQLLVDQAERYANSSDSIESEISRLSLEFYMELETDSQMKRSQINRVVSSIVHLSAPPEKTPCSPPDLYISKPDCEKSSRQPCHLVALIFESQANVCWKPLVTESKDSSTLLFSDQNREPIECSAHVNSSSSQKTHQPEGENHFNKNCQLNHFVGFLDFEGTPIHYSTNCQDCSDTLKINPTGPNSPIHAALKQNTSPNTLWTTHECHGTPSWNYELQNGHNFVLEDMSKGPKSKRYFAFRTEQCATELTRTLPFKKYF